MRESCADESLTRKVASRQENRMDLEYGSAVLIGLADDGWLVPRAEIILVVSWVGVRVL